MPDRPIAGTKRGPRQGRRQGMERKPRRHNPGCGIARRRPTQQAFVVQGKKLAVPAEDRPIRTAGKISHPLSGPATAALLRQLPIHLVCARTTFEIKGFRYRSGVRPRRITAAFETGPMPCSKRRNLIQKEQLGIALPHHLPLTALEGQHAADPAPAGLLSDYLFCFNIMDAATTIAHDGTACRLGNNPAIRPHAIAIAHPSVPC